MAALNALVVRAMVTAARLQTQEEGQGLAEYGLILALVAVVVVGAVTLLGKNLNTKLASIAGSI